MKGIEPPTPSLPWKCSTPELHWRFHRPRGIKVMSKPDENRSEDQS